VISELIRLQEDQKRIKNWKRWGTYLPERQWGTVREDYSDDNNVWNYFTHDHARSRAYRWGEDGLLGFTDRGNRLCIAPAIWNTKDSILKERFFGLTGPEGNHGEDVKEIFFYVDATPTSSYCKAIYKYPQATFPYQALLDENKNRGILKPEFEISETGVFESENYFDLVIEYAKADAEDILIKYTIFNRSAHTAPIYFLPNIWFRNTWAWPLSGERPGKKPWLALNSKGNTKQACIQGEHEELGSFNLFFSQENLQNVLFTENETNSLRLFKKNNISPYVKDAFHRYVCDGEKEAINPANKGTKAAPLYSCSIDGGSQIQIKLRLSFSKIRNSYSPLADDFDKIFETRRQEADQYYEHIDDGNLNKEQRLVSRQAHAGLFWSRQFYHYIVKESVSQDAFGSSANGTQRQHNARNKNWGHLFSKDIILMPDKWEYPWFAAWDLAFHVVALAKADPALAKHQLTLFLREWYMHPNGQIPAYEFSFSDVNPPVHAWAAFRVYKMTGKRGERDRPFLESVFQKLLLNFTWWVNRKDPSGNNLFSGGFLGLDNIGIFDRGASLPTGGHLQQADGTAWMAFYCVNMLAMALELARENPVYEDLASKFFEHFVTISDAMNSFGGSGLWDQEDKFYYDHLSVNNQHIPLKTRSLVGLLPITAVIALEEEELSRFPGFMKRMNWFLENRSDLAKNAIFGEISSSGTRRLLAIPSKERLKAVLSRMLDEEEFLSDYGIRSVSRFHKEHPYRFFVGSQEYKVDYVPGESNTSMFGGNSNWRGPIWFPINYLLVEALERYHYFFGDSFQIEYPTGSGKMFTLKDIAAQISRRLCSIFLTDENGKRPCFGSESALHEQDSWKDLILFHEFFNGDSGAGLGASHQTGWTALVTRLLSK
jgi:hypothetical protein